MKKYIEDPLMVAEMWEALIEASVGLHLATDTLDLIIRDRVYNAENCTHLIILKNEVEDRLKCVSMVINRASGRPTN